jgi:AAA domain
MGALWEEEAGRRDLDIARGLARAGIPVFLARPALSPDGTWDAAGGTGGCGYRLPTGWQHTKADPAVLDSWRDGWAVCAVMGHGLDALDTDPRHDGDIERSLLVEAGVWPRTYAEAATPSGGTHELVASLGVASRDGLRPGVDLKAGQNGTGRGFVFIAPTRRRSKVTFELNPYHWTRPPDLDAWAEWRDADDSGEALAELVRQARNGTRDAEPVQYDGPAHADLNPAEQRRLTAYTTKAVNGITDELRASASWPIGYTDDKRRGWEKLQADAAYRLGALARASWCPVTMDQAKAAFIAAAPTTGSWTLQNVKAKWASQCARGPVAEFPQGAEADPADPRQPSDDDETEAALDQAAELAQAVGRKLFDLRVYEIARDKLAAEKQPPSPPFDAGTLADVLTRPADPPARVVGLIPWEASTLVVAQRKTGKTTLMLNLARCLLTGEDFLGRFPVRPISGSVGFLNYEVSAAQLARWADEHGNPATGSTS